MDLIDKIYKFITIPKYRFYYLKKIGLFNRLPDKVFLEKEYKAYMGKNMDIDNPVGFNQKLQWLKIYDRKPEYSMMVDKFEVKKYVASIIGEEYIIPTLGIWENFDEIDFAKLPNQFVLKCTHDSGGVVICRDMKTFDLKKARKKINKSLKNDYYLKGGREWPYKNVKHKVIAEKYMQDGQTSELRDYKFYCFHGEPKFLYLSQGLEDHSTAQISFVELDWKRASFGRCDYKPFTELPPRPINYDLMIELARKLSMDIPFLRVDLYEINGNVYFGELTFTPCGGMMPFDPPTADIYVGEFLNLKKF
ncbi:glycosyl transferase [Enterococcus faecium]|nr:glycosyl transferase [Enterococcus faecium]